MFDVGSKVVCVDGRFPAGCNLESYLKQIPKEGDVYTVRDIIPAQGYQGEHKCAVLLDEVVNPPDPKGRGEFGFAPERFRPLEEIQQEQENNESYTLTL